LPIRWHGEPGCQEACAYVRAPVHLFDVGHLGGVSWLGLVLGTRSDRPNRKSPWRPGSSVVSAGLEMRDTQDHGEREEWFALVMAQDSGWYVFGSGWIGVLDRCRHHPFQGVDVDAFPKSSPLRPPTGEGWERGLAGQKRARC